MRSREAEGTRSSAVDVVTAGVLRQGGYSILLMPLNIPSELSKMKHIASLVLRETQFNEVQSNKRATNTIPSPLAPRSVVEYI